MDTAFETNVRTYLACLPDLLTDDGGKFALIGRSELQGVFDSREQAMSEGYSRFGRSGGFLVKEISLQYLEQGAEWLAECRS